MKRVGKKANLFDASESSPARLFLPVRVKEVLIAPVPT
jgi:hypothetical protein